MSSSTSSFNIVLNQLVSTIQHFIIHHDHQQQQQPQFLTNIVSSPRGGGKTHFLDCLHKAIAATTKQGDKTTKQYSSPICKQHTTLTSTVDSSSSDSKTTLQKHHHHIHHFHCAGLPSELEKMTLDVELFVEKELLKKKTPSNNDDDEKDTIGEQHVILATIDDYDLILLFNKIHNNNNNNNGDDDANTSSGASRFTSSSSAASSTPGNSPSLEELKKLTWGWFYEQFSAKNRSNRGRNENNNINTIESVHSSPFIKVILVVTTSSSASSSASAMYAAMQSTMWIFPDSLNWTINSDTNTLHHQKEEHEHSKELLMLRNLFGELIPETMRKVTASEEELIGRILLSKNSSDRDMNRILETAALLTQLRKSSSSSSSQKVQNELKFLLNLLSISETEKRDERMKPYIERAASKLSPTNAQKQQKEDEERKTSSFHSLYAQRSGCFTAFSRLTETIERFMFHYNRKNNNNNNEDQRQGQGGNVAAALQPPTGILVIDGDRCDGRAQLVADLALQHASAAIHGLSTHIVDAPLLFGPIFGETEERIRAAFSDAYAQRPCVLLIQNVDAIALSRGALQSSTSSSSSSSSSSPSSGNVLQRAVATFLIESDGVDRPDRSSSVLIVATTSNKHDIDSAALRPGRLEMHVQLSDFYSSPTTTNDGSTTNRQVNSENANLACDSSKVLIDSWFEFSTEGSSANTGKIRVQLESAESDLKSKLESYFQEVLVEDALRLIHELAGRQSVSEELMRKHFGI